MASIYLVILLAVLALAVEGSSKCWTSVHNDTIAFHSSAPITFSFDLKTATDCQNWCGEVTKCQSWVYVEYSNQCDLHRTAALSLSENIGFTFGGCDSINGTLPVATFAPSALSGIAAGIRVEMETGYPVRF